MKNIIIVKNVLLFFAIGLPYCLISVIFINLNNIGNNIITFLIGLIYGLIIGAYCTFKTLIELKNLNN